MPLDRTPNAALKRGLKLLERVSLSPRPVRYSELGELLAGVTDSTLSRLLQDLESLGYLHKASAGGYVVGSAWKEWQSRLGSEPENPQDAYQRMVLDLVCRTNESAGVAVLRGDRLMVTASRTAREGVSIIGEGDVLHFEADHAGALCVLADLSRSRRKTLLCSPFSRIASTQQYHEGLSRMKVEEGVFMDESILRPGICRMAAAFRKGAAIGSVFLCLTVSRAREDFRSLAAELRSMVA